MNNLNDSIILANFGGPREINEIQEFLISLLNDRDVIRTPLPNALNRWLFTWIAKRRSKKLAKDYTSIGGRSPIYFDTETLAEKLREKTGREIITFHRYLPKTHVSFLKQVNASKADRFTVFPLFPQFTYATTGSVARWFANNIPQESLHKMQWIKSYPTHPLFIEAHQLVIQNFLTENQLEKNNTILLFSAHGIPKKYVLEGDIYQDQCLQSFEKICAAFPDMLCRLSFQSKFGPGEWLRPYTSDVSAQIHSWNQGKENIVFIPISFTSDHIETLFEIEEDYMSVIVYKGLNAYRVPALNFHPKWIESIVHQLKSPQLSKTDELIRK